MSHKIIVPCIIAALLSGCSTLGSRDQGISSSTGLVNPGVQQAISEQRVVNDFKRQGIKVIYSLTGQIEAIETTGYAPVWGNSQNAVRESYRVAELEAKKAMNDFLNRETITSSISVSMISRNLEKAQDNKANSFTTNRGRDQVISEVTDDDVGSEGGGVSGTQQNTALRKDALNIASRVKTDISIRNAGILSGTYLVEGDVINNGKNVRVVYRWDRKHNAGRTDVRNLMMQ